MAKIEFQGWVEKELTGTNGQYGITVAEPHSRKQDDGSWKTIARTFHTVKGNATSGFRKGDRVTVEGTQKTETYTAQGETKYSLVVWADTVTPASTRSEPAPTEVGESWGADSWHTTDPDLPF